MTIAFLGGSITAQEGWRTGIFRYFEQTFPQIRFKQVNAAIPGTGSSLGACRLRRDVLSRKPDLVFLEFAVNDGNGLNSRLTFEGIVRQIHEHDPSTDICFVYTVWEAQVGEFLWKGQYQPSARQMEVVAEYYGIPSIHMAVEAARLMKENQLIFSGPWPEDGSGIMDGKMVFSPDGVHPYPKTGHVLYCQAIIRSLSVLRKNGNVREHPFPSKMPGHNWDQACLVSLDKVQLSSEWKRLNPDTNSIAADFSEFMPELWMADQAGQEIRIRFVGTDIGLYGVKGPDVGQMTVQIDDNPPFEMTFFDGYCTPGRWRLKSVFLVRNLANTLHEVSLIIHPDFPDKESILKERSNVNVKTEEYLHKRIYAGDIAIAGRLVDSSEITQEHLPKSSL